MSQATGGGGKGSGRRGRPFFRKKQPTAAQKTISVEELIAQVLADIQVEATAKIHVTNYISIDKKLEEPDLLMGQINALAKDMHEILLNKKLNKIHDLPPEDISRYKARVDALVSMVLDYVVQEPPKVTASPEPAPVANTKSTKRPLPPLPDDAFDKQFIFELKDKITNYFNYMTSDLKLDHLDPAARQDFIKKMDEALFAMTAISRVDFSALENLDRIVKEFAEPIQIQGSIIGINEGEAFNQVTKPYTEILRKFDKSPDDLHKILNGYQIEFLEVARSFLYENMKAVFEQAAIERLEFNKRNESTVKALLDQILQTSQALRDLHTHENIQEEEWLPVLPVEKFVGPVLPPRPKTKKNTKKPPIPPRPKV